MDIKKTKIIINGIETSFTDTGTGEPVLILHGWGASSDYWMEISRKFASSGFRAIALDFPGFGGSSAPNEVWGTSDYAEFINNFMREINLARTHLIGHSFGGAVAMKLCFNNPEKFDKLILCDAAAIRGKKLGARQTAAKLMSDVGAGLIKKTPFYRFFQKIAYRLAGSYNDYYQKDPIMREVFKKVVTEDLTDLMPRIKNSCLIIWGENDKATPLEDAFLLRDGIEGSELKVIEGVGHNPYRKKPEEFFASVLEFIKK